MLGVLLDEGWEKLISSNPYAKAFMVGAEVGTWLGDTVCNTLFSTDKTIEQYEKMKCLSEFTLLLNDVVNSMGDDYLDNKSIRTADKYFAAIDALFSAGYLSCDFATDYAEILYEDSGLGWLVIKEENYEEYMNQVSNIKSIYEEEEKSLLNSYLDCLEVDYPLIYDEVMGIHEVEAGVCGENVLYTLNSEGVLRIYGSGEMYNWENMQNESPFSWNANIKRVLIEEGVLSIGDYAFEGCSELVSVEISKGVEKIGDYVFSYCSNLDEIFVWDGNKNYVTIAGVLYTSNLETLICCPAKKDDVEILEEVTSIADGAFLECDNLTSIKIPEGIMKIGNNAFEKCSNLTSIKIPKGVRSIGDWAFASCIRLTDVDIPEGDISIGDYAFHWCTALTNIEIPHGVQRIGEGMFSDCHSLAGIEISESVISIGDYAFQNCNKLSGIEIPEGVASIGDDVFGSCDIFREIKVDDKNEYYMSYDGVLYTKDKSTLICCPQNKSAVTILEETTTISQSAFSDCKKLTSIEIPKGVTNIGEYAFGCCVNLTSVEIPQGVTRIEPATFDRCRSLINISIPEGVTSIGYTALSGCSSLTSITIPESVSNIEWGVFRGCDELLLNVSYDSYAHKYATDNNMAFKLLNEGNGESVEGNISGTQDTTKPSENPSQSKKPLDNTNIQQAGKPSDSTTEQIILQNIVKKVQSDACEYEVTATGTVTLTGLKKSKTKNLTIPKTITVNGTKYKVTAIADNAFKNAKLTSLTIGGNIKTIGTSAFENCKSLTKVTIGGNVTKINKNAFINCKKLKTITIKSNKLKSVGKNAFKGIKSTAKIKVQKKKMNVYKKLLKKAGIGKKVRIVK